MCLVQGTRQNPGVNTRVFTIQSILEFSWKQDGLNTKLGDYQEKTVSQRSVGRANWLMCPHEAYFS